MVTWVTQEMLYNGDDDSAFALDCMESNGFRPRTAQKQLLVAFEACNTNLTGMVGSVGSDAIDCS